MTPLGLSSRADQRLDAACSRAIIDHQVIVSGGPDQLSLQGPYPRSLRRANGLPAAATRNGSSVRAAFGTLGSDDYTPGAVVRAASRNGGRL